MLHFTEAATCDDIIIDDMMKQKELVPMEQENEEGDDQLKHWELTEDSEGTQVITRYDS